MTSPTQARAHVPASVPQRRVTLISPGATATTITTCDPADEAKARADGWTDFCEPWNVAICAGCARAISDKTGSWQSPDGFVCPPGGHQADIFPRANGAYRVSCAAGCYLGASAIASDLDDAKARVIIHADATSLFSVRSTPR